MKTFQELRAEFDSALIAEDSAFRELLAHPEVKTETMRLEKLMKDKSFPEQFAYLDEMVRDTISSKTPSYYAAYAKTKELEFQAKCEMLRHDGYILERYDENSLHWAKKETTASEDHREPLE